MDDVELNAELTPTVTVVMAAYNAEGTIARAIESVLNQSLTNWELICIDDGSTDTTSAIIENYVKCDRRIRFFSQENKGHPTARHRGYLMGHGEYFIILDSDDWFDTETLSTLVSEARQTDADGVSCLAMYGDGESSIWYSFNEQRNQLVGQCYSGLEAFVLTFPWRIHGICLWRRRIIESVISDSSYLFNDYNADEYLTRLLFLKCGKVVIGSGLYYVFQNPHSISRSRNWKQFKSLETDRRLTELALRSTTDRRILSAAMDWQRRGILQNVRKMGYSSEIEHLPFVLRELMSSLLHYFRYSILYGSKFRLLTLLFHIVMNIVLGLLSRNETAVNASRKLKSMLRRIREV